jgi:hypothetical protein
VAAHGECDAGATCRILDWRLVTDDDALRAVHGEAAGGTCPGAATGDLALTDFVSEPNTFLIHAIELIGDEVGDDDGLCETGEACVYAANLGAYQGDGDSDESTCSVADGLVSGVTLGVYESNGVP